MVLCASNVMLHTSNIEDLQQVVSGDFPLIPFDEQQIVLTDLDLTLIQPTTILGSAPLYDWMLEKAMREKGLSKQEAMTHIKDLNHAVSQYAMSAPVEGQQTLDVVTEVKKKAFFMGCTARRPDIAGQTLEQLKIAGISLMQNQERLFIFIENDTVIAQYSEGVLFTGSNYSKGEIVEKFIQQTSLACRQIVLIDDMEENLKAMAKKSSEMGVKFIGIHYTGYKGTPLSDQQAVEALSPIIQADQELSAKYSYMI